ncbi:hypothetical protein R1sor_014673 [Riccia sorocarpa]|uniref:PB1 domain-containing protein n=1 Tax=Riccia sorocarpa TaxID=122646 RepID=A0ABD3HCX0_9MARC
MSTVSGSSVEDRQDQEETLDGSRNTPQKTGRCKNARGKNKVGPKGTLPETSVRTRAQKKLEHVSKSSDTMSVDTLWKDEPVDNSSVRGTCSTIIDKFKVNFNGKHIPKIPLCRLEAFTRVRKLHMNSSQTEDLKRSFRLNGYMESCHGFHVSPVDENGTELVVTAQDEDMLTVWMEVSSEDKYHNSEMHHPRVRCVIVRPPPDALKEMEIAMHNLNITSHATVQYDWIQDAERTYQVLSTPLIEYKALLGDKVYQDLEESRKKATTKGWYSGNMTITAGAYIMSYNEVMAAQKELKLLEKHFEETGKPWTAQQ